MYGGSQSRLRKPPGEIAVLRHHDRHVRQLARQHQRLVTGDIYAGPKHSALTHDDDALSETLAAVSTAENRGVLTHRDKDSADESRDGCLSAAANGQRAHADHRLL